MKRKFSEVLTIINGRNQKSVENPNGAYPIYGSGGIMGYADDYLCPGNTVIIGRKGNINKPIYVDKPFWNVDTAFGLQATETKLLPKYLFYFCQRYNFEKHNKTVTIPSLTKSDLLEIVIDVPEIDRQERICAEFDAIESLICNRQKALLQLDELVKSRFIEMFFNTTDSTKWKKAKIVDVCEDTRTGPFGSSLHHDEFVDEGIFVLGIDNAVENKFSYNRMRYITPEKYEQLKRYTVKPKDVIITIMGTVGRSAVIPDDMPTAINTKHLACLTPKQEIIDSHFLAQAFQIHPEIRGQLAAQTKGAIMDGLNLTIIKNLTVNVPPLPLQKEYVSFFKQADKSKFAVQQSIDTLQTLKAKLMQDYFG